jgi:hypothetical protein
MQTVINQARRRRANRQMSKPTVKMRHTGSTLPTEPQRFDVELESVLGRSNVINHHINRKFDIKKTFKIASYRDEM